MLDTLRRVLARWEALSVAGGPTDRDLAELGLSRDQADRLAALPPGVPARMRGIAAIFGLPPAAIEANRADWIELAEICSGCGEGRACGAALAEPDRATPTEVAAFCPNARHYSFLALPG
jgi:hypothetical protein